MSDDIRTGLGRAVDALSLEVIRLTDERDAARAEVARLVARNMALQECIVDGLGWDGVEPRWRREAEALLATRAEAPAAEGEGKP